MVRLLGFVALIALVALVLLWSSEHFAPQAPAPEKAAAPEVQQAVSRPASARTPPPPPEVAVAAADAGGTGPRPASTPPDREAPSPPADPPEATAQAEAPAETPAVAQKTPPAAAQETSPADMDATGGQQAGPATAQNAVQSDDPAQDVVASAPDPAQRPASPSGTTQSTTATRSSPASPAPRAETPASEAPPASAPSPAPGSSPASASSPVSAPAPASGSSPSPESSTIAYAQPAGPDTAGIPSPRASASGDPAPRPAPPAADQSGGAEARIEERLIAEEEFVALEQAQGLIDERTDAQRRRQEEDGWYGWGVLNEYADPDRAARLLGGVPVVRAGDRFHTVRERAGQIRVRPIANVSAAYGAVGLRAHDAALRQRVRRAIASGLLLGREADHELLHLFPRREAAHLGNKVVKVFECHVRESGLRGEAVERFRKQAKLRGAVVALRRANGGRLGVLLPRYFRTGEGRVPVAAPCREIDEESRRAALAMAAPPAAPAAPGGG